MRRRFDLVLAAPVLLGPAALAFAKGGYFDVPRLVAGVIACAVVVVVAARDARPVPRDALLAVGGLAALTAWTGASIAWAPIAGAASDDFQRLLLYLFAFVAALSVLRPPSVRRLVEPVLLAGIVAAAVYGLSERLLPGVFALQPLPSADDRLAWPLTYWNAMGALAGMGLVLAAWIPSRIAAAVAPILGLACYLTFSRGALGATAAGLAVLVALAPTAAQARRVAVVGGAAILAAAATIALPAVEAPGGSSAQGVAMLAILAALGAAAAWLAPARRERARAEAALGAASPVSSALPDRAAPHSGATPADGAAPTGAGATSERVPALRAAALGALALAFVATAIAVTRVERTGAGPAQGANPSRLVSAQSNRYEYWRVAVDEFAGAPLQGGGSGSFRTDWLRERPIAETVRDAHSLYFETAAELGLVGLAALILFIAGVVVMARRSPDAAGAIGALAVYAIHAGLDWDWELPALTLVALTLAARLAAADVPPDAS
jgi:O-antigen ligase/polysaccharide polymerase Wzy-like membrane protein